MKLSVIIPCYNAGSLIDKQLEALTQQSWSDTWEVVVSDNGSTDGSREIVRRYERRLPNLRVVDASASRGDWYARNIGVRMSSGEAIAFCDADDVVAPGWLTAMGEALTKFGFVTCRVDTEKLNPEWTQIHDNRSHAKDLAKLTWFPYLPHAPGCSLGVRRAVFESVGGFEPIRILTDTDFCIRVQLAGVPLQYVADAVVYWRYRATYKELYRQAFNYSQFTVLVFQKHRVRRNRGLWRWKPYWHEWKWAFQNGWRNIRSAKGRARFVWDLGWQFGTLWGCVKCRIPPPAPE